MKIHIIIIMKVNPMNFNNLKQNCDKIWNDQKQKACSEEIFVERLELLMPELHQKLFVHKLETRNYPPESGRCDVKRQSCKHSCRLSNI